MDDSDWDDDWYYDDYVEEEWPVGGSISVTYRTDLHVTGYMREMAGLGDNDLPKMANNVADVHVMLDDWGSWVFGLSVSIDGETIFVEDCESYHTFCDFEVPLPTRQLEPGIHTIRFSATHEGPGDPVTGEEEIRVLLNVSTLLAGDEVVWLGTFEHGLLAWDLGEQVMDTADDRFETLAWQAGPPRPPDQVVVDLSARPTNALLATAHATPTALWLGGLHTGLVALDHGGTPFHRWDDTWMTFTLPYCGFQLGDHGCGGDRFAPTDLGDHRTGFELANTIHAIAPDPDRHGLWLGTAAGLVFYDPGAELFDSADDRWVTFPSAAKYDANIASLALDAAGRLWIASFDPPATGEGWDTVMVLDAGDDPFDFGDDRWARFPPTASGLPSTAFTIVIDEQDLKWIGTTDGLFLLDDAGTPFDPSDDAWARRGLDSGLPDDDVSAILPRADGTLWVGTFDVCGGDGGGLSLLQLAGGRAAPATCGGGSPLRAGTVRRCGALHPQADRVVVSYGVADGLPDSDVAAILELPGGEVAAGTFNLLAAPALMGHRAVPLTAELEECQPGAGPRSTLDETPTPWTGGADGLTLIDIGGSAPSKEDDHIVNL